MHVQIGDEVAVAFITYFNRFSLSADICECVLPHTLSRLTLSILEDTIDDKDSDLKPSGMKCYEALLLNCKIWNYPLGYATPSHVRCQGNTRGHLSKLKVSPPHRKIDVTSKSPVGDISVVTLIRTDTTLDHSQKAEKVWQDFGITLMNRIWSWSVSFFQLRQCRIICEASAAN